ncbi:putative membrane protein YoaS [Bacteroidia bacterium]|nr:putative membrane protein YoaS [Bacteroidia bacterium]
MKKNLTLLLQAVLVAIGIGVFVFMLWEPQLEGVNAHKTLFEIYFKDPFVAYLYAASVPFFVALYQAFKVLGYVRHDKIYSQPAANALRKIKYCAFITAGAIAAADAYLLLLAPRNDSDDPTGAVVLGMAAIFVSVIGGTAAAVFGRTVRNGVNASAKKL